MKLKEIKPNPRNPRKIDKAQLERLMESIKRDPEFMMLRPIVVDQDGVILGGHQRLKAIKKLGMKDVPDGWILKAENLTDEQRKRFILVDNAPDGMSGDWLTDILIEDFDIPSLEELGFDLKEFNLDGPGKLDGKDDTYTNKIVAPVYEPKGERPAISAMIDRTKTDELIKGINKAGLPEDVAEFMRHAAERHTVFHFRHIAEFYCHADPVLQDLMERSGMIIIDFKKAIEYGFVHLTEQLGRLADLEESDDDT